MNPFFEKYQTPFESVPFHLIKNEHFLPALTKGIEEGRADISSIKSNQDKPTFHNVCEALEEAGELINKVASVFFNLHSAESNDELQKIAKEFSPMLTEYSNDIFLDPELFSKVKSVYDEKDNLNLTVEEETLLTNQYKSFVRNGALLSSDQKEKVRAIDKELSSLKLNFGDNVLEETNSFLLVIDNESDLKGLPDYAIEAAAGKAKEKGHEGKWAFGLDAPSYIPVATYLENREIREKMYKAYTSRAFKGDKFDNSDNIKKIAQLRYERAKILGYESHSHFVLEERMAQNPNKVKEFLSNFLDKAKPIGIKEIDELKKYTEENGGPKASDFKPWDYSFWSEKLKKERFSLNDELLKPYLKLENVIDGVFKVANKLFGLKFKERKDIPAYHEDVKVFEVLDENEKHVSVFFADFFPRDGKRAGAWMTSYREQHVKNGNDVRPLVSIVCNFSKPTSTKPSLLTFNEVTTLFHEFGHALHGMLSNCKYSSVGGTNVYWDFVELPSQILENWAYEKECLDLFANHYETGEKIPAEYIQKIKESSNFHEGRMTLRQISFGLLDMAWHSIDPKNVSDVAKFEEEAMASAEILPKVAGSNMSVSFSHIFQGGYSSGYYSYKWAEVLDADAFEAFKEKGIFNKEVATSFRENILSKGGSEHPMELYKKFRGHEPTPDALLKRAGLV